MQVRADYLGQFFSFWPEASVPTEENHLLKGHAEVAPQNLPGMLVGAFIFGAG